MSDALSLGMLVRAMHMGALHPFELVLTLVLAFGPFVVLGLVIAVRRRHPDEPDEQPPPDLTT